jgi:hypothetical protein
LCPDRCNEENWPIPQRNFLVGEELVNTDVGIALDASELKKKSKCAGGSESLPTRLLCNQYNPECDGKSAIRIWVKFQRSKIS